MANQDDLQQKLKVGIDAARSGDKATARSLLREVVNADPENELAWMWLASAVTSIEERRECLREALRINPENTRAREALGRLGGAAPPPARSRFRRQAVPDAASDDGDGPGLMTVVIGAVVVLAVITALIFALISSQQPPDIDPDRIVAALSPSFTPSVDPNTFTATPSPFMVIVTPDITLPPTFTPTFTPTPSETPLPSATPYPLSEFGMLYTSIGQGETIPSLYRARGDGSDEEVLIEDVRDIAFDPSGQKVAFVRETTTTMGEGDEAQTVEAVELFVAPVDNLSGAVQITEFGSTISSPTWAPNGVQLAFVSDFNGDEDIWTITDDGENILVLTDNTSIDRDPAWSPDGSQIVYVSDQDSPGLTRLFSMTPDGQNVQRLNDLPGNSYQPRWSNDGTQIVFVNDGTGDADIYIADAQGQRSLLLTADDGGADDRQPVFTPDDQWISFVSNRISGIYQLFLVDLRGNVLVELTETDSDIQDVDYRPELLLRLNRN